MTAQEVDYFEPILGKKISSITLDDVHGIVNIGLENDVHIQLRAEIQAQTILVPGVIPIRIVGEIVNVS